MAQVWIVLGSDSDLPKFQPAFDMLRKFSIPFACRIASAHRDPQRVAQLAAAAEAGEADILIAGAGMAAHLAGVLAAQTVRPVIGVPLSGSALAGQDALLSTVQMPRGIPVATVGIDQTANAALLAVAILALSQPELGAKLSAYRDELKQGVRKKDKDLQENGPTSGRA